MRFKWALCSPPFQRMDALEAGRGSAGCYLRSTNRKRSPTPLFAAQRGRGCRRRKRGVRLIRWTRLPEFDAVVIANNQVLRNNGQRLKISSKCRKGEDGGFFVFNRVPR